jgi:indoleamine 2,3-dioxygenase
MAASRCAPVLITWVCSAGFKPFMEYAGSYALFNYRLEKPERGLEYENLRMVRESGALVQGTVEMLEGCTAQDRESFDNGLRTLVKGLRQVNAVMNSKLRA